MLIFLYTSLAASAMETWVLRMVRLLLPACCRPFAVTRLLAVACDAGRSEEVYDLLKDMALPCTECVAVLSENCQRRQGSSFAMRVEKEARSGHAAFTVSGPGALRGDAEDQPPHRRGMCGALWPVCEEAKFLRFADEIVSMCVPAVVC